LFPIPSDAELDRYVTPRTRMFLFSNPGNPTGAVYPPEMLERLARWCRRHDLWLVADEVYRRIWFDRLPTSAFELRGHEDHVVVIDSMSKTFSLCGLRLGFFLSRNEQLMERVERLGQARLGPQPRAQKAAVAALGLPPAFYEEVRQIYQRRVDAMMGALAKIPDVAFHRPEGAFYTMVRLPVADTEAFARFMAAEFRDTSGGRAESVVVAPGPGFYADPASGMTEIRLAAVREEGELRRGIEVLGRGLEAWRGQGRG